MEKDLNQDKFKALWVSNSSISDYLRCPRSYYLRNVYKNPLTGKKMAIVTPPLALGQVVHDFIESRSVLSLEERLEGDWKKQFKEMWSGISGEMGGFENKEQEKEYWERGWEMLSFLKANPGPLAEKTIKLDFEGGLAYYWLSREENIILCGKIDWLEYLPVTDSLHVIDFKTGKREEGEESLQLPIYFLVTKHVQKRMIKKMSYFYLYNQKGLVEKPLPDEKEMAEKILVLAQRIKLARALNHFSCPQKGCRWCLPYEMVLRGEAKKVGLGNYNQEVYILKSS